nr:hypothetical protein [uncultured Desulfobacter sp.]
MDFPGFHIPLIGDGMSIALIAVTHVFIIGFVTIIVLLENLAYIRNDKELDQLARNMLKPVVIIITAVGAVTGAGIWFTVSVLAPNGIGSLLRVFFWPWFFEWMAFTIAAWVYFSRIPDTFGTHKIFAIIPGKWCHSCRNFQEIRWRLKPWQPTFTNWASTGVLKMSRAGLINEEMP